MPDAWFKSKRVWCVVVLAVGLLTCAYLVSALVSTHAARGHAHPDPLIGRWSCVKSFGLLNEVQVELHLGFASDRSLTVEVAAKNGLGTSPEGGAAGRGTWERRGDHQVLLTIENLTFDFDAFPSGKHTRRVRKWVKKLVKVVAAGNRELVLADLFPSGPYVFTRLSD